MGQSRLTVTMGTVKTILVCAFLVLDGVGTAPSHQRSKRQGQGFPQHLQQFYKSQPNRVNQSQLQYSQNAPQFSPQGSTLAKLQEPVKSLFDQIVQNINSGHRARAKVNPNYNPNIPTENPQPNVIVSPSSTASPTIRSNPQVSAAPAIESPKPLQVRTSNPTNLGLALFKSLDDDIQQPIKLSTETNIVQNRAIAQVVTASDKGIAGVSAVQQLEKIIEDQRRANLEYQEKQLQQLEAAKAQLEMQIQNQKQLEIKFQQRKIEDDKTGEAIVEQEEGETKLELEQAENIQKLAGGEENRTKEEEKQRDLELAELEREKDRQKELKLEEEEKLKTLELEKERQKKLKIELEEEKKSRALELE